MTQEEYIQNLKDELHIDILAYVVEGIAESQKILLFRSKVFVEHFNAMPSTLYFYYSPQLISSKLKKLAKLGYIKRLLKDDWWLSDKFPSGYWRITEFGCHYLLNETSVSKRTKDNATKVLELLQKAR